MLFEPVMRIFLRSGRLVEQSALLPTRLSPEVAVALPKCATVELARVLA